MENGAAPRAPFHHDALPFPRAGAAGGPAASAAAAAAAYRTHTSPAVADGRFFRQPGAYWSPRSAEPSDEEEDEVDGDDEEEDDEPDEGDGFVSVDEANTKNNNNSNINRNGNSNNNNSSGSVQSSSENLHSERGMKDGSGEQYEQVRARSYENAITVVEPEQYYSSDILHNGVGLGVGQKENGCGFGGRKEMALSIDSGESVRTHLSDPITGVLMDDAMILSCGHSFGSGGMQHVYRMKACSKCAQPVSEDSVRPNLALRAAVQAFRREEELHSFKASKRRRDRFEQDKSGYEDPFPVDLSRGKGVQFPFAVSDRVIIKGNKRTPERFVGRMAVVTTQCLNGWYVVKTLDNAESVKLQYRSLAKVTDEPSSNSNTASNKAITPSWL